MLFIEFSTNLSNNDNLLKYRNIEDDTWYYMYIDIETLNLLVANYGIISSHKSTCIDNLTTGKEIKVNYCGSNITLYCQNNTPFYLPYMEQNY